MTIQFYPSQLRDAQGAALLRGLVEEMADADCEGELRVLQDYRGEPTRLVLVARGKKPATIEVSHTWLYSTPPEEELRRCLSELMYRVN